MSRIRYVLRPRNGKRAGRWVVAAVTLVIAMSILSAARLSFWRCRDVEAVAGLDGFPVTDLRVTSEFIVDDASARPNATDARTRLIRMRSAELMGVDPRRLGLSAEEIDWMRRHYFPTDEDLERLAILDVEPLKGTRDPMLATLHGLKLLRDGDYGLASAILQRAGAMGSIYALEEAAVAEYRRYAERFGPSIDNDDIMMARLEVVRILGDYKVDYLVEKYLPAYPMQERSSVVQKHVTTFLEKLGEEGQMTGQPTPGPDPRPNQKAWRELQAQATEDPTRMVELHVLD